MSFRTSSSKVAAIPVEAKGKGNAKRGSFAAWHAGFTIVLFIPACDCDIRLIGHNRPGRTACIHGQGVAIVVSVSEESIRGGIDDGRGPPVSNLRTTNHSSNGRCPGLSDEGRQSAVAGCIKA